MRATAFHWGPINNESKQNWERRVAFLNTRHIPGLLTIIPHNNLSNNLDTTVVTPLQQSWKSFWLGTSHFTTIDLSP